MGVPIFISDKIDFKTKAIKKDKGGRDIMIKGSIQEEDTILVNIYAPTTGAPKYTKQILTDIKRETGNNIIIVGEFNTPLRSMDRSSRQKISKATEVLTETIDQLDLIYIYRTLHSKKVEYTFFSSMHGTCSRIGHILGHKTNLNKFKKIEIMSSIFCDHNGMKLEINYKKKNTKKTNMWRLNNMLLKRKKQWINDEIKE